LLFGIGGLPITAFALARWLLSAFVALAELPMRLPEVAFPFAFDEAIVPCAPALLLPCPEWLALALPLATPLPLLTFVPLLPPALWFLPPTLLLP
jgi:hypothetical protein